MKRKILVIAGLLGICLVGSFNQPVLATTECSSTYCTASHAYCIERVLPESYVYYYDPEQTEWAGWCSTTAFDGCHYDCVGDITDYYRVSNNTIVCEDCG